MNYQTFRGADVQEALFNVRQALGTDALIESTRHVQNGAGGPLGRTCVEIAGARSPAQPPADAGEVGWAP
jgi:flagellar biosynthesis GTPase FlhF